MAIYYFNEAVDGDWTNLSNWWLDPGHTLSASNLPGPSDDVVAIGTVHTLPGDVVVNSVVFDGDNLDLTEKQYSIAAQSFLFKDSLIYQATLSGNTTLFQSDDDGVNDFHGNVTLSGSNYTSSESTVHGNLFIHYPTIAGNLDLPTVIGTTTVVNYKFEEYPDYNFNISGLSVSGANVFYGYYAINIKPRWQSLDGLYRFFYDPDNHWYLGTGDFEFISDQQNVDYPWNVTSWTLNYGEVTGTPVFNLVPFNKSNIIVSGIGNSGVEGLDLNGEYVLGYRGFANWWGDSGGEQVGTNEDRPFYVKTNGSINYEDWSYIIRYDYSDGGLWFIYNDNVWPFYLFENTDQPSSYYPTDVATWPQFAGSTIDGTPVLRFAGSSSQNTFGLPPDVIALITSRFGSVANFLRLRNQGQI